jgi:5,10-methylene-tetrahydrofolate dehydrogenase/methenyl tetrahydrofolate cyclohydrolase
MGEHFKTDEAGNAPCTPLGCIELLDRSGIDIAGKHVVRMGASESASSAHSCSWSHG